MFIAYLFNRFPKKDNLDLIECIRTQIHKTRVIFVKYFNLARFALIISLKFNHRLFSLCRHSRSKIYGRTNLSRSVVPGRILRQRFCERVSQKGIRNGHVDKRPAFGATVMVINIGGNKRSLNQIVVARSWAGCREYAFRQRRRRRR